MSSQARSTKTGIVVLSTTTGGYKDMNDVLSAFPEFVHRIAVLQCNGDLGHPTPVVSGLTGGSDNTNDCRLFVSSVDTPNITRSESVCAFLTSPLFQQFITGLDNVLMFSSDIHNIMR